MIEVIINILFEADKIIAEQEKENNNNLDQLKTINQELSEIDQLLEKGHRL